LKALALDRKDSILRNNVKNRSVLPDIKHPANPDV